MFLRFWGRWCGIYWRKNRTNRRLWQKFIFMDWIWHCSRSGSGSRWQI